MSRQYPWFKQVCAGCGADSVGAWQKANPPVCLACGSTHRRMQFVKYLTTSERHQVKEEMNRKGMMSFEQFREFGQYQEDFPN